MPGLDAPPWPGELGERVYKNVSLEAWKLWEERMKMILNEYRLLPFQKEAQELMARQMTEFFFGAVLGAAGRLRAARHEVAALPTHSAHRVRRVAARPAPAAAPVLCCTGFPNRSAEEGP